MELINWMIDATMKNIPTLRFPEFKDAPEWEEKSLHKTANFVNKKISLSSLDAKKYISTENILQDFAGFKKTNTLPPAGSATEFRAGDILVSNIRPYLKKIWVADFEGGASNDVIVIRASESINQKFLSYILKNDVFIDFVMTGAKGVKMPRGDIALIKQYPLFVPHEQNEQQKIANCLTSLDEFITSSAKKVEALKEHKTALMQQLFPSEGERVPKLRFPEFKDAPEWEEKILDEVVNYENGKAHENDISENGKYTVVNSKFISTEGDIRKYTNKAFCLANVDDMLMVLSDVPNGRAIAKCYLVESDDLYTVNQRICRLSSKQAVSKFLFYILDRNKYFLSFDDGVKQTNLRKEDVLNCPILIPSNQEEQQKIADCLSSLDELITSQTGKVQTLKEHKKGLMQQLFPNSEVNK